MAEEFRVTYATLSADDDALHGDYDRAVETVRSRLGAEHRFVVAGEERGDPGAPDAIVERAPFDRDLVLGRVATAGPADVDAAVGAAVDHAPAWAATPWAERVAVLRRAADLISERRSELSALVAFEVGKNRLEALGDVEETADLVRYYCHEMEAHGGFEQAMGCLVPTEATYDVMRPYGAWAVVSPFNFPAALSIGPAGAALVAGNTVVLKPAEQAAISGLALVAVLQEAGVPAGALHVVTGPGETGAALVADPRIAGCTFTGSYEVGMQILHGFAGEWPKPVICEMGGKNPVIVTAQADLDEAAEGTMRSAFGLTGQKCSAASRAFVERPVFDEFVARLCERAAGVRVGNPLARDVWMGPVIDEAACERYERAVAEARTSGTVHCGGERLRDGDLARGGFVAPAVVEVPEDSWIWSTELFVPLVAVAPVESLDEALARANGVPLGLTAGMFSHDRGEVERFLARIEAGVIYVNRRAGATTGAWPGVQPFGGWKGSGTGGKAGGGPYYVQQYLREQSRTIVGELPG